MPYQSFETADGFVIIGAGNDSQFVKLCSAIGAPELATLPEFATNDQCVNPNIYPSNVADVFDIRRVRNRATLIPLLAEIIKKRNKAHWMAELKKAGIPITNINNIAETFAEEQLVHRKMITDIPGSHGK